MIWVKLAASRIRNSRRYQLTGHGIAASDGAF